VNIVYPSNTADLRGLPTLSRTAAAAPVVIASRLSRRRIALASATLLALAVAAFGASPAGAASSANCAKQVIADWYDNNRVDRIYPLRCYRQAIKLLPVDVRVYSGAEDDILRALLYAQQGDPDPGDTGEGNNSGNGDGGSDEGTSGGSGNPDGSDPGPGSQPSPVDTSGPSAVPVPLIVLAGIAGLLMVLGAAGYVTRRVAASRGDDEPPA